MKDEDKTREQLLEELNGLRQRVDKLEEVENERRQIEEELKANEHRLVNSQRAAKVGNYDWDLLTNKVIWSDEMYRFFGVDKETNAPTVEDFASFIHPDDLHVLSQENFERAKSERYHEMEYRIIDQTTREVKSVHLWGEVVTDSEGTPIHILGTLQDITESKQAEKALQESEERFRSLFQAMNEGVCLHEVVYDDSNVAIDYRILNANPQYEKMLGLSRDGVLGKLASEVYGSDEPPYLDIYTEVARTGNPARFETYFPPLDKYFSISAFSPGEGRFATVFEDITERKQAEEALRLFKTVVDTSQEAIAITDSNGAFVYINPAHEKLFGRSLEEACTLNYRDYYPPESIEILNNEVAPALSRGVTWEGELEAIDATGRCFPLWEHADTVFEAEGKMLYSFGIMHDITDRKRMEQTLIRSERHHVASELSAGMCHNLNNILSGISGPALMLQRVTRDSESLHDIEAIISSSKRAADLVHQLSVSVRGQSGEKSYSINLNEAIEQTLQLTQTRWESQPAAQEIDIDILVELGEVPSIRGTEPGIQEMIANLIFNAVDAMPKGGEIRVQTQIEDDFIRLSFRDTGIGMDEETRRRVFEPFFTKKMDIGAGLGLSTLHGILTHWGGKVEVESAPGKGTTFTLYFPVWAE